MANIPLQNVVIPIADIKEANNVWCVFEHHLPPQILYVGACKLIDVFKMREARDNSEWAKIYANGGGVQLAITMITDNRNEAFRVAMERVRSLDPMPRCNMHGYNMHRTARTLICSNGQTYKSQSDAAQALGISQSNISKHLAGDLTHVNGHTFAYAVPDAAT